ncbi:HAD family hydrolase [Oxalobacteraceae bacterium A2-2]
MSIDVIFIGLDGVLFDTEAQHLAACNAALADSGLAPWTLPALRLAARSHGYAHALCGAVASEPLARDRRWKARLLADWARHFQREITSRAPQAARATLALIEEAREAGCKLSVISDLPAAASAALLEQAFGDEVTSLFAVVAGDARFKGPAGTGPYARALHAMGIAPADGIAIDTSLTALRAAEDSGLWTVSVPPCGSEAARGRLIGYHDLRELRISPFTANPQERDALAA